MGENIKKYLKEMFLNNDKNLFLFNRFYFYPGDVLGGEDENTISEYFNYGNIKEIIESYKIFEFILLCMSDDDFRRRIDGRENLVKKMEMLVNDFREYRNNYNGIFYNENFINMFNEKEENIKFQEKYQLILFLSYKKYYDKIGWVYKTNIEHEKSLEVSDKVLIQLLSKFKQWDTIYQQRYVLPKIKEDNFIELIKKGEYKDAFEDLEFIIGNPTYMNQSLLRAVMCSNKLLDLCVSDLLNRNISYYDLEAIMSLIEISLDLYNKDFDVDSLYALYYVMIGEKRINEYNSELAEQIIDKFESKIKNSKVIKLY